MCFSLVVVPFFWQIIALKKLPVVAALVAFVILGHLLMIRAFAAAPDNKIPPYGYAELLFAIFFGLILFDETPDPFTLLGAIVIVGTDLYVWYRAKLTQAQDNYD